MRLAKLSLEGFRCFSTKTTIDFNDLTAFVGTNATGKTAVLLALVRMFGTTQPARTLTKDDFHRNGANAEDQLSLTLEAWFDFPELESDVEAAASPAVPACLKHIISDEDAKPFCRIRLTGTWQKSITPDGDAEQTLEWIATSADTPSKDHIHPLRAVERALIQVVYVPASRDALKELRGVSGTLLSRALQHVDWPQQTHDQLLELNKAMSTVLRSATRFGELETGLQTEWSNLRGNGVGKPELTIVDSDLSALLRRLDASFVSDSGLSNQPAKLLSEGERSLLYFSLVAASLSFESAMLSSGGVDSAELPVLTILAVEEPENHLAPQYLGRILKTLRAIESHRNAQVVLTSHSASILRRVSPTEIRHFRLANSVPIVSRLTLPSGSDEAHKYVLNAVQRYPELYYAKVVVFGEGASEEVVIPRIAAALGIELDPQFVAMVPLGGRHVNHFWKLLQDLGTPYLTLLDLDTARAGGCWGRIANVNHQLMSLGKQACDVWGEEMTEKDRRELALDPPVAEHDPVLKTWLDVLETDFGVFFSGPLDLDFLMLRAFADAYEVLDGDKTGPRIPADGTKRAEYFERVTRTVLGADGGDASVYQTQDVELFAWYAYLFISGSKPSRHAATLSRLTEKQIRTGCPPVLARLVERIRVLTGE
jgi:putative ATP-dependent endonuclease of OLD family